MTAGKVHRASGTSRPAGVPSRPRARRRHARGCRRPGAPSRHGRSHGTRSCERHADHDHAHGPDRGRTAIQHEGHVGQLHDGHLHCAHEDHCADHGPVALARRARRLTRRRSTAADARSIQERVGAGAPADGAASWTRAPPRKDQVSIRPAVSSGPSCIASAICWKNSASRAPVRSSEWMTCASAWMISTRSSCVRFLATPAT